MTLAGTERPTDPTAAALWDCARFLYQMCAPACKTCREDRLLVLHQTENELGIKCSCDLVARDFMPEDA